MIGTCECEKVNWVTNDEMFDQHKIHICSECKFAVIWKY